MDVNKKIVDFIHQLYENSEFIPLSAPKFIGNEKSILQNVLILHLFPA